MASNSMLPLRGGVSSGWSLHETVSWFYRKMVLSAPPNTRLIILLILASLQSLTKLTCIMKGSSMLRDLEMASVQSPVVFIPACKNLVHCKQRVEPFEFFIIFVGMILNLISPLSGFTKFAKEIHNTFLHTHFRAWLCSTFALDRR